MTTQHDLEPIVRDWLHNTLDTIPDPTHRYGLVAAEVNETPQQRRWMPVPLPAQHTMWSTAKAIVAISIVALFGGFLLFGSLATQDVGETIPATVPEGSVFPTGMFESKKDGLTLEFRTDGTCQRVDVPCTFGVIGRYFSEMAFEEPSGPQVPATYGWAFDGDELTFELWGVDKRPDRHDVYANHVFRPVGETTPLPATDFGFPTGYFVNADGSGSPSLLFRDVGKVSSDSGGNAHYTVSGDLWTEAVNYPGISGVELTPATYRWTWDGKRLQFVLWGEDTNRWRTNDLVGHVFVRDETRPQPDDVRRLLLSHPQLDVWARVEICLLYTSDAADDSSVV